VEELDPDYRTTEKTKEAKSPEKMLGLVKGKVTGSIVLLPDFHSYLTNPLIVRLIKEIGQQYYLTHATLVFVSHAFSVPDEIERICAHFEVSMLLNERVLVLVKEEAEIWAMKTKQKNTKGISKQ